MNSKILLLSAYLIFIPILNYSQNEIGFDIDYAKFNYDNESVYLELYYSFAQSSLEKISEDSSIIISANLQVDLTDENDNSIISESYRLNSSVDTTSVKYTAEDLIGVLGFQVPCGNYNLAVSVKDNFGGGNSKTFSKEIDLSSLGDSSLSISDIQLCSKIIQDGADPNSIYYKNSLETIPNPKTLYGSNLPVLYYYLELYNNKLSNISNIRFERTLLRSNNIVNNFDENVSLDNSAVVKAGFINLSKYSSGRYTLVAKIVDSLNNVLAKSSKNFFVYNPQNKNIASSSDPKLGYIRSEFGIFNEEECDHNFEVSKYIAAESEKDLFESLNELDAKRKFLYEFWKKRDLSPETPFNEFKYEYMGRVAYVNSNYGHRLREGYKTDRGRIALVYGIPDRVETLTNDAEFKPYEVWNYDAIEGGVLFIFGDTMGVSELELLHSTKRGEVYNQNWRTRLTIKGGY